MVWDLGLPEGVDGEALEGRDQPIAKEEQDEDYAHHVGDAAERSLGEYSVIEEEDGDFNRGEGGNVA